MRNHYWRNVTLGELKTAIARDDNGAIMYEVVYSSIIDDLVNSDGQSPPQEIVWPTEIVVNSGPYFTDSTLIYDSDTYYDPAPLIRTITVFVIGQVLTIDTIDGVEVGMNVTGVGVTNDPDGKPPVITEISGNTITLNVLQLFNQNNQIILSRPVTTSDGSPHFRELYPNALKNMRTRIETTLGVNNDDSLLPRWMTSQQKNGESLGFTPAWVICYVKPGYGRMVIERIQQRWPYKLNEIEFKMDRFEVDRSMTWNYLGKTFPQPLYPDGRPIWDTLPSAQPPVTNNSRDSYVYFPYKTILPRNFGA
jgi:hypothetical protein